MPFGRIMRPPSPPTTRVLRAFHHQTITILQGDTSGMTKPPIDIKTKVALRYKIFILKCNFCFDVNESFGPT